MVTYLDLKGNATPDAVPDSFAITDVKLRIDAAALYRLKRFFRRRCEVTTAESVAGKSPL